MKLDIACSVLAVLGLCLTSNANMLRGKVVQVIDGDTLIVLDESCIQHNVRLDKIDAPEKDQAYGEASKKTPIAVKVSIPSFHR